MCICDVVVEVVLDEGWLLVGDVVLCLCEVEFELVLGLLLVLLVLVECWCLCFGFIYDLCSKVECGLCLVVGVLYVLLC